MKNFIISLFLFIVFSCTSSDVDIKEISFIYDNSNAQPSLVSSNGYLSLTWISADEDMNNSLNFRQFKDEKWTDPQILASWF